MWFVPAPEDSWYSKDQLAQLVLHQGRTGIEVCAQYSGFERDYLKDCFLSYLNLTAERGE